jgi:hypothetical protein
VVNPRSQCNARLLSDLELDWASGFPLEDDGSGCNLPRTTDIVDAKTDQIAAPQLAVDREIEKRQTPYSSGQLEPNANRPDLPEFEWWFLTEQLARSIGFRAFLRAVHTEHCVLPSCCEWGSSSVAGRPPVVCAEIPSFNVANGRSFPVFRRSFGAWYASDDWVLSTRIRHSHFSK